jgi:hypothetical protein
MGLLDFLGSSDSGGGGLLGFLRQNAMQQQFPNSPDQAQYGQPMNAVAQMQPQQIMRQNQPSPLDSAQWPSGPMGAPSQANAQMPPPSPPASIMPQAESPGGFGAALRGFIGNLHNGPIGALAGGIGAAAGMQDPSVSAKNLTARALLAKGVDANDVQAALSQPHLMEALIKQHYGPKNIQSIGEGFVYDPQSGKVVRAYTPEKQPMSLGSGYIYQNGKVVRAYEPEDKIPAGFAKGEDGNMRFIPGGPADPAYLRMAEAQKKDPNAVHVLGREGELYKIDGEGNPVIVHKNAPNDSASIGDDTAKLLAERTLMGDTKALTGLGRGAQGAANILKVHDLATRIAAEKGINAKGILDNVAQQAGLVSASRALGTKETHFGVAEKAMEESLPIARAASDALDRTDFKTLTKLIQMGQTEHNNPILKKFLIATDTAAKDYARTINPTGTLRESDILYARKILSTADSKEAYNAALEQLQVEAGVMHRAIQRQKDELHGKKESAPSSGNKTPSGVSWMVVH